MYVLSTEPPSAPVGPLEVKDVGSTTAVVSWKPSEKDGGLPIKFYAVDRRDVKRNTWVKVIFSLKTNYQV